MRVKDKIRWGVLLTWCTLLMVSCVGDRGAVPTNGAVDIPLITDTVSSPHPLDLEGVTWVLTTYLDAKGNRLSVMPGTEITAEFIDGQVSGSAGCNNYFADYFTENGNLNIQVVTSTEMFCLKPTGLMQQEEAFLEAIKEAQSYQIADRRLQIMDRQRQTRLILVVSN